MPQPVRTTQSRKLVRKKEESLRTNQQQTEAQTQSQDQRLTGENGEGSAVFSVAAASGTACTHDAITKASKEERRETENKPTTDRGTNTNAESKTYR